MKKDILLRILLFFAVTIFITGFCLITNSARSPKTYLPADLPFYYHLNNSIPEAYIDAIYKGAVVWNNVEGSYFEFQRGDDTPVTFVGRDGVNLVFFDLQGVNFSDPNVIAFSMTFSSNSPRYRAVESDLVWNAKDHPPSPTGDPNGIDLQSTMAHEFGHHLGLDHTGLPSGASSGCGPFVPDATMWWSTSNGDTTGRNLHPEDIIGVTVLYPNWVLEGHIIDASTASPLIGAKVNISNGYAARLGELNSNYWYTVSGYILQNIPTDQSGFFSSPVSQKSFIASTKFFGYYPATMDVNFNTPSGYGNTQTIVFNASLLKTPIVNFTGKIIDTVNNTPVSAVIDFYWIDRPDSLLFSVNTDEAGNYSKSLPGNEYYIVKVKMNLPYVNEKIYDTVFVSESGINLDVLLKPVNILYVVDEPALSTFEKYTKYLDATGVEYAYLQNELTPLLPEDISLFSHPLTLIWSSGAANSSGISTEENELIKMHLRNGGNLILAGKNIVEYSIGDSLIENYIGVTFNGNHLSPFSLRGFAGHPVGNDISFSSSIPSKDIFNITDTQMSSVQKAFHYGSGAADSVKIAAVTFEGNSYNYKGFLLGLGIEAIGNEETAIEILSRIFNWLYDGNIADINESSIQPAVYRLLQNYPNPFNPVTTIMYTIPLQEKVTIKIFDSIGREIETLVNEVQNAGSYVVTFNAGSLASGVYYYRMTTENYSDTKKLILLK